MKLLIGFVGRKRSGKDTLAKMAQNVCSDINILSFAGPLKQACKRTYHLSDDQIELSKDVVDERWGVTPRDMMRSLGTGYFRSEDPEHWLKNMGFRMHGLESVVISDVRFENEALFIRSKGGILIHVSRDLPGEEDDHVTETTSDEIVCGYSIENNGSLKDLESKFTGLMRVVMEQLAPV